MRLRWGKRKEARPSVTRSSVWAGEKAARAAAGNAEEGKQVSEAPSQPIVVTRNIWATTNHNNQMVDPTYPEYEDSGLGVAV